MVSPYASTVERIAVVRELLGHAGEYGCVSTVSRAMGVSRPTLYRWRERGQRALEEAFTLQPVRSVVTPALERAILTLLVKGHASDRGIAACLAAVGRAASVGTICGVIQEAQRRAVALLAQPVEVGPRVLALDEIYGNDRHGAYLSVVDAATSAVYAATGPLPVDQETWTLVLWAQQERGLRWPGTVSDGGAALTGACLRVDPDGRHQHDVWHVLRTCSQVQGRMDRAVAALVARTPTVARQAARMAAGQRPRGKQPRTDVVAHSAEVIRARDVAAGLRSLTGDLRRLLAVVVLTPAGVLDAAARQGELDALLALLGELAAVAPAPQHAELMRLQQQLTGALPGLLAFVPEVERVQQQWGVALGAPGLALVAWAWRHRDVLGPTIDDLLAGLPAAWATAARVMCATWDAAVRASSAVETWHSLVRPHLAVHRTLSTGMLALLAVHHNHTVATRGFHTGLSPLQRSGDPTAPSDWLVALGYPPLPTAAIATPTDRQKEAA